MHNKTLLDNVANAPLQSSPLGEKIQIEIGIAIDGV